MLIAGHALADRFELRRRIGAGGMGEVFEAYDRARNEIVALKTLSRADGATLARFKREFRALQSIAHPNLVSLRELVRDGDHWFFTMELVDGRSFIEHVRGRAPSAAPGAALGDPMTRGTGGGGTARYDEARLRGALGQLAGALRTLHHAGLVHRDVKSSNVMVAADGRVVLLDFGLVTDTDPTRQSTDGRPVGTVEYMAPEQASGAKVSEATDWYAMGVLLYEALTGRVPHNGHLLQILVDKQQVVPTPVDRFAPDAPPDLVVLCADLLRIEPAARPTDDEIATRLGTDGTADSTSSLLPASGAFVGRERELAELMWSFERSRAQPIVHLVTGESGIGKSELVARFANLLGGASSTLVALAGRCYERESVPFKAVDGVADGLAQHLARLDEADVKELLPPRPHLLLRLFPVFQRVDAIAAAPAATDDYADAQEQRRRMFVALRELLVKLTTRVPVLVTVDDLQWADADSFLLLRQLLRGADAPRVLVLATVRSDAGAPDQVVEQLGGLEVRRTTLGPLSIDESLALAQQLAPDLAARADLGRLMREAGGHPLFLQEMLRHQEAGAAGATLDDALWSRIGLLQSEARRLLECVCIGGQPIATEVAMHACRLDATAIGRATASLRVASLAREVQRGRGLALEPYHDRVREAVTNRLGVEPKRVHHARLAAALEAVGDRDPQLLLRNFVLGGMPERAARYAEEAAQRSMDAHAFDQAAELWKTALELVPRSPDEKRRLLLRLGAALVNAGRGADAAEQYLAAVDGADPATRLDARRNAAEQLLISGRIERGIAVLFELLTDIGVAVPATPRRALASLLYHRTILRVRGLSFAERHRREIADADLIQIEVLRAAAHGLAMVDSIRGADFQTRALLLALKTGYRPQVARLLTLESMFQSTQMNIARAAMLLDRAVETRGEADPYIEAMVAGGRGLIDYFTGHNDPAIEHLRRAIDGVRSVPGSTWELYTARLFDVYAIRLRGDAVELRRLYDSYLADAALRGDQYLDSTMRRACVPMWLAEDDPGAARRDLERASWVPDTVAFHVQHYLELIARGDISLYAGGEPDPLIGPMFERLSSSMLRRITTIRVQTEYTRGRLAIAAGELRVARGIARGLERDANLSGQVWGHLLRGVLTAVDDREAACRRLERAHVAAAQTGMRLSSAVARYRLAELRGDPTTDAAADIAALGFRKPDKIVATYAPLARPR